MFQSENGGALSQAGVDFGRGGRHKSRRTRGTDGASEGGKRGGAGTGAGSGAAAVCDPCRADRLLALTADWPRDIAPGSGLKLAGLGATVATALVAWGISIRGQEHPRTRRISALFCGMVALLAWPLWSVGVLPSVNGAVLRDPFEVEMLLQRTEATRQRRSPDYHHWAWLAAPKEGGGLPSGRYFIPETTYDRLTAERPATITAEGATGLLGAVVVTAIR